MNENLDNAQEEIKRADHLIFVSLKYTRTCDVLKHIIERHINCIDFTFTALLEHLKEQGKIEEVPTAPIPKANKIKELFPDDEYLKELVITIIKSESPETTEDDTKQIANFVCKFKNYRTQLVKELMMLETKE